MILCILIPNFWIVVEERRCPDLRHRPVVIANGFLEARGGNAMVLMNNDLAEGFGVRPGLSLAHVRQLCPEAVILSPEPSLYSVVWDEVLALLLAYTPLVEAIAPGEAICDVSGCERLFGDPSIIAGNILRQIEELSLPTFAGIGSNRLVAQFAASMVANKQDGPSHRLEVIPAGREAGFLAPFPVTSLPEIDSETLLAFQVLGIKNVHHLTKIPEKAMAARFGQMGGRLARYARGLDDRPVKPAMRVPTVSAGRRLDDDIFDGLDVDALIRRLVDLLSSDLTRALKERRLAGRLLRLMVRSTRQSSTTRLSGEVMESRSPYANAAEPLGYTSGVQRTVYAEREVMAIGESRSPYANAAEPLGCMPGSEYCDRFEKGAMVSTNESQPQAFSDSSPFPNQDARIHSMLPQPKQSGGARYIDPMPGSTKAGKSAQSSDSDLQEKLVSDPPPQPGIAVRAAVRMATTRPVDDLATISVLTGRLLARVLSSLCIGSGLAAPSRALEDGSRFMDDSSPPKAREIDALLREPGLEVLLEMSRFAPPEQMALPGLDGRSLDGRLAKLQRQERLLAARFGTSPFRHLEAVNLDSVLPEGVFRWGRGL